MRTAGLAKDALRKCIATGDELIAQNSFLLPRSIDICSKSFTLGYRNEDGVGVLRAAKSLFTPRDELEQFGVRKAANLSVFDAYQSHECLRSVVDDFGKLFDVISIKGTEAIKRLST